MEITEEELRKMSPAQILELQKKNCIFCQIIAGKVPSKKLYESDIAIALLDINPANPGHAILIPKEHFQIMALMPEETLGEFFVSAKLISKAMLRALKAEGSTIFAANGTVAGQRAPHFMLHIIPRFENDSLNIEIPQLAASHDSVLRLLKAKIGEVFGSAEIGEAEIGESTEIINLTKKPEEEFEMNRELIMEEREEAVPKEKKEEKPKEIERKKPVGNDKKPGSGINLDDLAEFLGGKHG